MRLFNALQQLLIVATTVLVPGVALANDVYITQAAAGAGNGLNCANAKAVSHFNTSTNWVAGTPTGTQIGPGTIAHLCGIFTFNSGATGISVQGSGTRGNPITILFEPGAILQAPDFGAGAAAIRLDGANYITVDGGGSGNAAAGTFITSGLIQATLSGTAGAACIGGPCTRNNGSTAISATNTNGITIQNLEIRNMYLRTSFTDQAPDWANYFCIHASPSNSLIIDNNKMSQSGEIIGVNGDNMIIRNNDINNTNHGISLGAGATSYINTYIYNNHIHDMASWDAGSPYPYHHDGIHVFPGGPGYDTSLFIYNNTFDGDIGASAPTGWIYMEQTCCTGGTAWIFNNYATSVPYRSAPAMFGIYSSAQIYFLNNTIVGNGYSGGGVGCDIGRLDSGIALAKNNSAERNHMAGTSKGTRQFRGSLRSTSTRILMGPLPGMLLI